MLSVANRSRPATLAFRLSIQKNIIPSISRFYSRNVSTDDVSRLNKTHVANIYKPLSVKDLKDILARAKENKKKIAVKGTSHSMGGHSIAKDGYIVDTIFMNKMEYDPISKTVTVGPGATWGDLIMYLNQFGLSPSIMQSYCSFSVGGTISVNAHGITSDYALHDSVVRMNVLTADGNVVSCSRYSNRELFSAVIGGYGLFGVIVDITLKVVPNTKLALSFTALNYQTFPSHFSQLMHDKTVEIKLGRINLVDASQISLFAFRKKLDASTVSDIEGSPRGMTIAAQLLYKWVMPLKFMKSLRFKLEQMRQLPLDWINSSDRNVIMYESAETLAKVYQPIVKMDRTFILQEYFIPQTNFIPWMESVKELIEEEYGDRVRLLNVTVRFVKKDTLTLLPYAQTDVYAFVFYFRIPLTQEADDKLKRIHSKLVEQALVFNGTFYLPYRHHYSIGQLAAAYPMIDTFFLTKQKLDPENLFSNLWAERYGPQYATKVQKSDKQEAAKTKNQNFVLNEVSERRYNSFQAIMASHNLKRKMEGFLKVIFNIENPKEIMKIVEQASRIPFSKDDHRIYQNIQATLAERPLQPIHKAKYFAKSLKQLIEQKRELVQETVSIINKLGLSENIHTYVSIGDSGKLVRPLKKALKMKGAMYVVHDKPRQLDWVERGSLSEVGAFVPIDYTELAPIPIVHSSADLVTLNMGAHHLPQERLTWFFRDIFNILRPGGIFIIREHNATPDLIPILDMAHMVFNAVTAVRFEDEKSEIRAFRTVDNWIKIIESVGFENSLLYEMQKGDTTEDYMMCFVKPMTSEMPVIPNITLPVDTTNVKSMDQVSQLIKTDIASRHKLITQDSSASYYRLPEWQIVRIVEGYGAFLNHTPWYRFPYMSVIGLYWSTLARETRYLIANRGVKTALLNSGLLMDSVIGMVMSGMFTTLFAFAVPLKLIYGVNNSDSTLAESEQLLVLSDTKRSEADWHTIHSSIHPIPSNVNVPNSHSYILEVPKHRPFTAIIIALSKLTDLQLLEISNQKDNLQMEVVAKNSDDVAWLRTLPGCQVIIDFKYPFAPREQNVALSVNIPSLLSVVKSCLENGITIRQVYDFF